MRFEDIAVPEVYTQESADFRLFLRWIQLCFEKTKYDHENFIDLYDPQRCRSDLLWILGATMGFKYDDRVTPAVNRLILLYFMSMIRLKGSKDGVTLAAEVNLAQFNIIEYGKEKEILNNRLEDTSIPVNSVYVTPHVAEGYIDVVYFSDRRPIDTCIEYVRPVGMYLFQYAGVRFDARTRITVDGRLTNIEDDGMSIAPTHVGHYSRDDYARMQRMWDESNRVVNEDDTRELAWKRNSKYEKDPTVNPGYRALYNLQLCNNDHIVKSLLGPIFSLGYGPQDVDTVYPDDYLKPLYYDRPIGKKPVDPWLAWNLRMDRKMEEDITNDVWTLDDDRTESIIKARPAVNPIMAKLGDAMSDNVLNTEYYMTTEDGSIVKKPSDEL